jgi:hypothetical protein
MHFGTIIRHTLNTKQLSAKNSSRFKTLEDFNLPDEDRDSHLRVTWPKLSARMGLCLRSYHLFLVQTSDSFDKRVFEIWIEFGKQREHFLTGSSIFSRGYTTVLMS